MRRGLVAAMVGSLSLAVVWSMVGQAQAKNFTLSAVTVETLAHGSVKDLPAGKVFLSLLDFSQFPSVACGPACSLPGFVYTLHGVATISVPGAAAASVSPGAAAFTPEVVANTNRDAQVGADAIAVGLIFVAILLCAAT
jgi:hypothetical protein